MALDPNIPLQAGQIRNPLLDFSQGIQQGSQLAGQYQQIQANKAAMAQKQMESKRAGILAGLQQLGGYQTLEERRAALPQIREFVRGNFGVEFDDGDVPDSELTDNFITSSISALQSGPNSRLTEYQKQSLALQKERLNQPTANERDLKTYQRLKKESPEDAKMFAQDVGLLPKEDTLSSTGEKALLDAQDSYFKGSKDAREYELLAGDFERETANLPAGVNYSINEFIKNVTGSQDEATELRRRFNSVRLSEALVNLPPGPATDKDVQEAFKGVPKEGASPQQVVSFLRGSAKLKKLDNEFNLFKADYISEKNNTKGLLKAWQKKMRDGDVEALSEFNNNSGNSTETPNVGRFQIEVVQ